MRAVAKLPADDRRALFANTADKTGLTTAIIEKDFLVCWTLDYLFHRCKWKDNLAFKGGTSLSKAFHLIERFSEDLDLILDWRVLGYGKEEPWEQRSKTKQERFNDEANERASCFLRNEFVSALQDDISTELGENVQIEVDESDTQTILFTYPQESSDHPILQQIRLEIGALAVWTPSEQKDIKSYAAEHYAHVFADPTTSILTILPERTFWEKATILHHEANRSESSKMPSRYSRHYYDVFCLASSWVRAAAIADLDLLSRVTVFKEKFYPRAWARYMEAKPGSIKLVPPQHNLRILEEDYEHMQAMIFGKKLSFAELMQGVQALEHEINNL